jgi:hypothetical protein
MRTVVEETLEAVVAHGDILEHRDIEGQEQPTAMLLYAAPASFVARESGKVILLGVVHDQLSALPDDLQARIEHAKHVRRLRPLPDEDLRAPLLELGLIELSHDGWLRAPRLEGSAEHLARLNVLLDAAHSSRDVPGLLILDPERSVRYYRGRWAEPRSQSGRFVARRSQAYGAALWCYVELRDGTPERLIDLPLPKSRWRGCDEAWHLQMAIDARRGQPQRFRVRPVSEGSHLLEFFSPVPMWARRRWDAVGDPIQSSECLFAYRLPDAELKEEIKFIRNMLWLDELSVRV